MLSPSISEMVVSMDVTFPESEYFFLHPQLSLQGEQRCVEEISVSPLSPMMMIKMETRKEVENEREEVGDERVVDKAPETERVEGGPKEKELLVYSRGTWGKRKEPKEIPETETTASSLPLPFSLSDEDSSGNSDIDTPSPNDLDVPIAVRKGVRSCTQHPISQFVSYSNLSPSYRGFLSKISSISLPHRVQDALADPKWKHAMIEEMKTLHKCGTWELTTLPNGKKTVGCKWVYTVKHKANGSVEQFKARLVAKGSLKLMVWIMRRPLHQLQK